MDKFWENYITTRPADSKGAFDAFKQMHQDPRPMALEPRNMADGGRIGFKDKGYVKKAPEERWKSRSYPAQEAKEKNLKKIFDKIFDEGDWGGIRGDRRGHGLIPDDWFRKHVSKAIRSP